MKTRATDTDATALWEQRFQETVAWLRAHPDGETPLRHGKHAALGYWWATQRREWRAGRLDAMRHRRLKAAGFPFEPVVRKAGSGESYEHRLAQAKRFRKEFGHLRIPYHTAAPYEGLGKWAQKARRGTLPGWVLDRIKEDMPELRARRDDDPRVHEGARKRTWQDNFAKLTAFVKRFGHANVPRDWPEDPSLGIWVYKQRCRHRDGRMARAEYLQLMRVGFVFNPRPGPDPERPVSSVSTNR